MAFDYDLIVLGAGPAGEKGAVQAAYFGKRVAIVECAKEPGGAAVHTGTLPSKTLRETALFLSGYRQRDLYGVDVRLNRELAVPKLLSRKDAVRDLEVARIRWNLERHGVETLHGVARFVDAHTVEIVQLGGPPRTLTSEFFLVATGSKPHQPADIPFDDEDVDDSDTVLLIDRLPRTMTIVGGGVIGCEYATMFAALQVKVTLIEGRGRLLPFLDLEMGERLRASMNGLGIEIILNAKTKKVARLEGCGIRCELESGAMIDSDKFLFAAGRSGRTEELRLDRMGVKLDKRGYVAVNDDYRTEVPSIYAAGDVIGFPALASTSMEQARVAVCHAFDFAYKRQVSHVLPYGVYTIPEVSCVGLSEESCTEQKIPYAVGRAFYRDNARGKIVGDKDGVIKLIFHAETRELLGCHCIGDRASELVHIGQALLMGKGTVDTFIEMVFNYPTLAEAFKYAAYDALARLAKTPAKDPPKVPVP
ncbi:Si-specific NAD(P)(+) transhydrogenase [Pendulispora rubella]|uniref:Soluble pyridine nucleotide transhydrogenase n=1 Tax=Pendulispora rubella TaxID=2741070 RepID=A0ABZ2KXE0_9BACT